MSAEAGVWAVVVARVAHGAKSRLTPALDATQRRELALAMLGDVLTVCADARFLLSGVVAVVDDRAARAQAEHFGALVVDDLAPGEMNIAVRLGLDTVKRLGAKTAIVLPGDVPQITAADLETLLGAAADATRAVVVGASRDGL